MTPIFWEDFLFTNATCFFWGGGEVTVPGGAKRRGSNAD